MDIRAVPGRIESAEADAIILSLFEGAQPSDGTAVVDAALNGAIKELITDGDFTGKAGQVAVLYPRGESGEGDQPVARHWRRGIGDRRGSAGGDRRFSAGPVYLSRAEN
jgi:hypothetical protein